jgi:hypothetical protein
MQKRGVPVRHRNPFDIDWDSGLSHRHFNDVVFCITLFNGEQHTMRHVGLDLRNWTSNPRVIRASVSKTIEPAIDPQTPPKKPIRRTLAVCGSMLRATVPSTIPPVQQVTRRRVRYVSLFHLQEHLAIRPRASNRLRKSSRSDIRPVGSGSRFQCARCASGFRAQCSSLRPSVPHTSQETPQGELRCPSARPSACPVAQLRRRGPA